ncbi:hypothetical protein Q1695_001159 [Nippostrongylus brasiliensis]|nr:hypothetical protein Q1695_001159 [Nippostrongylus brasiliensis]
MLVVLALLLSYSFAGTVLGTRTAVLKFTVHTDKIDLGSQLFYQIDVLDQNSGHYRASVLGVAARQNNDFKGLTLLKNVSRNLALIKFDHPKLNQDTIAFTVQKGRNDQMKISTDQYRVAVDQSITSVKTAQLLEELNSCSCEPRKCACCAEVDLPDFHHQICTNVTYNAQTIGLDFSLGVDGHFYSFEISLRNPPPICISLPFSEDMASMCIAFSHLDISKSKHTLSGCVELEAEVIHMRVLRLHLGCFVMPI